MIHSGFAEFDNDLVLVKHRLKNHVVKNTEIEYGWKKGNEGR